MASHCDDCIKGVLQEGEPVGTFEKFAGVETYVSLPTGEYDKTKAVVFLGDVFGQYTNAKLMCDGLAANGFATYFPDYLDADPIPTDKMNDPTWDKAGWFQRHAGTWKAPAQAVIDKLKADGVTSIGATGYCYGGGPVLYFLLKHDIQAGVVAHPAQIAFPDDINNLLKSGTAPLLINACETDQTWPKSPNQDETNEILGGDKYKPGFKQNYYPGCTHGFATRGDMSVPAIKFGKEDAFKETALWFKKYL